MVLRLFVSDSDHIQSYIGESALIQSYFNWQLQGLPHQKPINMYFHDTEAASLISYISSTQ